MTTCPVPSVSYPNIQSAVSDPSCDIVQVAPGTYHENVSIGRRLVLDGAGAGSTIIQPTAPSPAITVTAGGSGSGSRLVISHLTTTGALGAGNTGSGILFNSAGDISHVTLDGVASTTNGGNGVAISSTGTMSDLVFTGVNLSNNTLDGFRIPTSLVSLDGLTITSSRLERNSFAGWEIYVANSATAQPVSNVLVQDTSFNGNTVKGVYAERLSNATFQRISVVGSGTTGAFAAGIDINLKYRAYQNILIEDSTITDDGAGDPANGVGIAIKARDDAPSYNTRPASLTGVQLLGNTFTRNTADAIRFGEPAKNNVGPTNVHVNQNSIQMDTRFGINNQTQTLTDGTCNWWGSATGPGPVGPGTGDKVSTNVTFQPWLIAPPPGGSCFGGNVPTNKDQCKKGGWQTRVRSDGTTFKNQGDCIQYVNTGK